MIDRMGTKAFPFLAGYIDVKIIDGRGREREKELVFLVGPHLN